MLHQARRPLSILVLLISACFNPNAEEKDSENTTEFGTDTGSLTTGSSGEDPTGFGTEQGEATNTTEPSTDSSGMLDEPPSISSFTVNGSTTPPELMTGGRITLDVDATDDFGIERVEFYDNGQLLVTVSESPYTSEVLLSSLDNGPHNVWARAVDTAEQEDLSDEVNFSVNIIGGDPLENRDFGTVQVLLFFSPTISAEGIELHVTARSEDPTDPETVGLGYWNYDSHLSLTQHIQTDAGHEEFEVNSNSPAIRTDSGTLLISGAAATGDESFTSAFYIDKTGTSINRVDFEPLTNLFPMEINMNSRGRIIATRDTTAVGSFSSDFSRTDWTNELGEGDDVFPYRVLIDDNDNIVVIYGAENCVASSSHCIRRIRPDGSTAWTRPLAGQAIASAVDTAGNTVVGTMPVDSAPAVYVFDPRGNSELLWTAETSDARILDLAYDQQGHIIAVGSISNGSVTDSTAWAVRLSNDGSVVWEETYAQLGVSSILTGITTDDEGRVFVVGVHDIFDAEFLAFSAEGFVAELAL